MTAGTTQGGLAGGAAVGTGAGGSILIAPDSFKGTHSAVEVAAAIGRGVGSRGRAAELCPLADGGEGTAAAVLEALGGTVERAIVRGPLGRPVEGSLALLDGGRIAIVEVASASGLALLEEAERDPEAASSYGTGELIAVAAASGAAEVLVAAGGSATVDGGAGALVAIESAGGLGGTGLGVLCDVRTPWEQAARRFGPQKGADAGAVERLERRLEEAARALPRDPRGVAMTGSAGGLAGGLWAVYGARLIAGADWVMDRVDFDARLALAGAVITGEGRLDEQTFEGKLCGQVIARAGERGVPVHAVVGGSALTPARAAAAGLATVTEASTLIELEAAGARVAADPA
jgi:glycerate kinase